ncbi:hypothetical protein [Rhizobium sp. SG2393]|uniref:hypothetical protein n=1 Tax=Rhizobium sp. SG2393 TaxID=3276279 RepID=UPI00366A6700
MQSLHSIAFATFAADFGVAKPHIRAYISAINTKEARDFLLPEVTPMLFIFSKPNFLQIAWNSQVPANQSRVRNMVADSPMGPLGFIRTRNVG